MIPMWDLIYPKNEQNGKTLPDQAPADLGNRSLIDLCQEYSTNVKTVLRILVQHEISAQETMSIKEIAGIAGKEAPSIYEIIKHGLDVESEDPE